MKHETHSQFTKTEGEREQRVKDEGGGVCCIIMALGDKRSRLFRKEPINELTINHTASE